VKTPLHDRVLVIGVGNEDRGDDGVGIMTVRRLRERMALPSVQIVEQSGDGTDLIDLWQSTTAQSVYLIDAMSSGAPAGSVLRFEADREPVSVLLAESSTHAFGVAQAIELARVLGCLPPQVVVYAIEGKCFEPGAALSTDVKAAVQIVAESIAASIEAVFLPEPTEARA
jgi:hydrogenase maturation protease